MVKPKPDLHQKVEEQNSILKKLIERFMPERGKYARERNEVQTSNPKKIKKKNTIVIKKRLLLLLLLFSSVLLYSQEYIDCKIRTDASFLNKPPAIAILKVHSIPFMPNKIRCFCTINR